VNPDLELRIEKLIQTGDYEDASDVLSHAIDLLAKEQKVRHLRFLLDDARSSTTTPVTPDLFVAIRERALKTFESGDLPKPDPDVWPSGER
jgi:Arc/MetJ-type ribon-helix-helix transcriptional regulator